jgi:hypothetical protein
MHFYTLCLLSPPYNRDHDAVGRMTDAQILGFFAVTRDEEGRPKQPPLQAGKTTRDYFADRCFFAGIWDPAVVRRLWVAEQERLRRLEADGGEA